MISNVISCAEFSLAPSLLDNFPCVTAQLKINPPKTGKVCKFIQLNYWLSEFYLTVHINSKLNNNSKFDNNGKFISNKALFCLLYIHVNDNREFCLENKNYILGLNCAKLRLNWLRLLLS